MDVGVETERLEVVVRQVGDVLRGGKHYAGHDQEKCVECRQSGTDTTWT
jgi:hypothetical protein